VWKIYSGDVVAVKDVTFTCEEKEFLAILGPSGGGKSSTLRMLAGLEEITRGEILFDGEVVNHLGPAERNIALAFESYALYQRMSVYENIAFPLRARGLGSSEVDKKVRVAAETFDLTDILEKRPSSLSGGHQQRVSLARALIREPKVTLLDEPISHMDQRIRAGLRARIRRIHNELGNTTVYVTHDQAEAISLCDRLAILHQAELQQVGTIDEIWNAPANRFVAYFVGEPAMNFISGKVEAPQQVSIPTPDGKRTFEFKGEVDSKYIGAEITIGLRPQQIGISRNEDQAASVPGVVKIVEFQGDKTNLTLELGDESNSEVKIVVPATEKYNTNETVRLQFGPDVIHLFDEEASILRRKTEQK
jgi:multiple sugar transport system ATP-binding protein